MLLLLLPACLRTSAHPGRTDAQGGHYDRSTGEYHYHHGYPAHQHENGECPYDFDDRTGENSGSRSSGERSLPPIETTTAVTTQKEKRNSLFDTVSEILIGIILYGIVFIPIIVGVIKEIVNKIKKR